MLVLRRAQSPNCNPMSSRSTLAAVLAALSSAPGLLAQTAPTAQAAASEETVVLDPFTVNTSTDKRWIATRSAAATKTNTSLVDLAHRVTAFNVEFLADTGADTLLDTLKFVGNSSGGDRRDDNSPGNATGPKLRGFNANTLEDGLPTGQGFFRRDFMGIERVEFVKGASAVLFGSTQPGGTINLISKTPTERQFTQVEAGLGEHGDWRAALDHNGVLVKSDTEQKAFSYRTVLSYRDTQTPRDYEEERSLYFNQSARLRWRDTTVVGRFEYQEVDGRESIGRPIGYANAAAPGGIVRLTESEMPYTFFRGEPGDRKDASSLKGHLNLTQLIGSDWAVSLTSKASRVDAYRIETFPGARIASQPPNLRTRNVQFVEQTTPPESWFSELNALGKLKTGPVNHELLLGANYGWSRSGLSTLTRRWEGGPLGGGLWNFFAPAYGAYTLGSQVSLQVTENRGNSRAYYVQDQFRLLSDRLIGVVGVRRDASAGRTVNVSLGQTTFSKLSKTSPRYSLLFKATPWASVYASFNEAFQGRPGGIRTGTVNEPLDPQESEQTEVGVKFTGLDGNLSVEIAAFEIVQTGFAVPDPAFPGTPFRLQSGEVTSEGWDVDLGWNLSEAWQLYGSFGFSDATVTNDSVRTNIGRRQVGVPEWSGGAFAKYSVTRGSLKGLSVGAGASYSSNKPGDVANTFLVPSYTVWNAMARYAWDRYSVALNVDNVFDKGYTASASSYEFAIPGDLRWARLTFTARF